MDLRVKIGPDRFMRVSCINTYVKLPNSFLWGRCGAGDRAVISTLSNI